MHRIYWCDCGQKMRVPAHLLGQTGACISCGRSITVTMANTAADAPPEIRPAGTPLTFGPGAPWIEPELPPVRRTQTGFVEGILNALNLASHGHNTGLAVVFLAVAGAGIAGIGLGSAALGAAWPGMRQYIAVERLSFILEVWWALGCAGLIMGGIARNVALDLVRRDTPTFGTGLAFSLRHALGLSQCIVAGALAAGAATVAVRAVPPLLMRIPSVGPVAAAIMVIPVFCLLVYFGFLAFQVFLIPAAMAFENSSALNGFSRILELVPRHGGRLLAYEMAAAAVAAPLTAVVGLLVLAGATIAAHACSTDLPAVVWRAGKHSGILHAMLGLLDRLGEAIPSLSSTWPLTKPLLTASAAADWAVLVSVSAVLAAAGALLLAFLSACCTIIYLSARDDIEG